MLDRLAAEGPWTAVFDHRTWPPGPVTDQLAAAGVTFLVGAPVTWDGRPVAHLVGVSTRPGAEEHAPGRMALFAEVATHAAALLGPQLAEEDALSSMRGRITDVIGGRRFRPVFQPVVDLSSGTTVGFEALTRFDDGSPPPAVFRDAAGVGLGHELELATMAAAVDGARSLADGWLSVNVSPATVLSGVAGALAGAQGRPLVLEVTEHVPVADYGELAAALARIPGTRVAVDDAGAGYASLRHILELRPDLVKLDIGLVRGIDGDPARQALVAGMAHFAAETGTQLLAEGVETAEEARTVQRLGVELAQGYLFGRPAPAPSG